MTIKSCCTDTNLSTPVRVKEDLEVRTCKICGAQHYMLTAEPGNFSWSLK